MGIVWYLIKIQMVSSKNPSSEADFLIFIRFVQYPPPVPLEGWEGYYGQSGPCDENSKVKTDCNK